MWNRLHPLPAPAAIATRAHATTRMYRFGRLSALLLHRPLLAILLSTRKLTDVFAIGFEQIICIIAKLMIPVLHYTSPDDSRIHQPPWLLIGDRSTCGSTYGTAEASPTYAVFYRVSVTREISICNSRADAGIGRMRHAARLTETARKSIRKILTQAPLSPELTKISVAKSQEWGGDTHQNGETPRSRSDAAEGHCEHSRGAAAPHSSSPLEEELNTCASAQREG